MFSFRKTSCCILIVLCQAVFAWSSDSEVLAKNYLEVASRLSDTGKFDEAIRTLNQALGILREYSTSHPLRQKIESEIKIAKGKFLLSRYDKIRKRKDPQNKAIPLKDEDRNWLVSQVFGKVISRQIWEDRTALVKGDPVGFGRRLTTFPSAE